MHEIINFLEDVNVPHTGKVLTDIDKEAQKANAINHLK